MNFGGGSEPVILEASLAERMLGDISVSDSTPTAVESFIGIRIVLKTLPVIVTVSRTSMLLAVCRGRHIGATGVRTFLFGLVWHNDLLSGRMKKGHS